MLAPYNKRIVTVILSRKLASSHLAVVASIHIESAIDLHSDKFSRK